MSETHSAEKGVCDGCRKRPCVCETVVLPSAEKDAHDCRGGCVGEPARWNERTGHWYCANGNDACPIPPGRGDE